MPAKPWEILLNDNITKMAKSNEDLLEWLKANYIAVQRAEAEKVPSSVKFYVVNVATQRFVGGVAGQAQAMQVLRKSQNRKEVSFYNFGPSDLIVSNQWFDPLSILQLFSDPNTPDAVLPAFNQVVQIGFLPSGGTLTFQGQDPIWVHNVDQTKNSLTTIYETVFLDPHGPDNADMPPVGLDGLIGQGYTTAKNVDGDDILLKGLR